ncbi:MAG: 3-mercaptopyruvate sulfurtransferase [Parvularculaceae bacterium]|nr:3-mercaptopyruvate sulfurtransferase [Parvularculaceae bacterium]
MPTPLVDVEWLAARLGRAGIAVVDASWRMPGGGRARDDYDKRHIDGAVFFDLDAISDAASPLPHMLPSPEDFSQAVGALGIAPTDAVVVYDDQGIFSAARVWWTFRAMGHRTVAVLDGGLKAWIAAGHPTVSGATHRPPTTYRAAAPLARVATADDVRAASRAKSAAILDARPTERFLGAAPEPRPGLRSGHIPTAASLPFGALLTPQGTMRRPAELAETLALAGLDERPVIATCGSGVTAAVIVLALAALGRDDVSLYDGAFAEWGQQTQDPALFPVARGEAP